MKTSIETTHVVRRPIKYWPSFDSLRVWTLSVIRDHYWRVSYYMEPEDLLHEAHVVFNRLCKRYPRVNNAAHFGSLYRRSLINRIHDLSDKASRQPSQIPVDDEGKWLIREPAIDSGVELLVVIREVVGGSEPALESLRETAKSFGIELPARGQIIRLLRQALEMEV